jgi:hypothetical protein
MEFPESMNLEQKIAGLETILRKKMTENGSRDSSFETEESG